MIYVSITAVFIVLLSCVIDAQDPNGNDAKKMKCYNRRLQPIRCVPEFVNAAFNRKVESNNTCGTPRSEYCVQTLSSGQRTQCEICDAKVVALSHPSFFITDVKDDKNYSWWQSDTLYTLRQNNVYDPDTRRTPVRLTLDLGKTFEIVSIRLRFRSLRPESMAIFKRTSKEFKEWIPYQYFSRSCYDTYRVDPDGLITRDNLQSPLCTARYSQLVPLSGGEVLFRTLAHRPGRDEIERLPALQDWIRAYSLRFDLDRLNTFGDDIFGDPKVLRSYYYAIIDLTVVGKCDCNGHASQCLRSARGRDWTCDCEHFTDGVDCEKCLPFYNNRPWRKATSRNANPCQACDCNGLADVCEFDEELYRRTGRGGRCVGCRNDTGGPFCERCRDNYHRENDNDVCKPCNCNPIGSQSLQCHTDGRCYCKQGVTGDKCDRCRPNHYGFSEDGCSACQCSVAGTRPDSFQCDENGQCTCKKYVIGRNCDQCMKGHFALETDNPYGCRQCFCFGHSSDCKSASGFSSINRTSVFLFGVEEWTVLNRKGEDVTRQFATWDQRNQNVRVTSINQDSLYLSAPATYLGNKRSSYSRVLAFRFKVADTSNMQITPNDIILIAKGGLKISTSLTGQGNPVPTRSFQTYRYRLHEDYSFDWMPELNAFDFQRLLDDLTELKIRMTYSDQGTGFIDDISLEYAKRVDNSVDTVNWVEQCTCPPAYVGLSCEECLDAHKRETVNGSSYDRCIGCECNNHAAKCDPDTGKCVCEDNTVGDDCSRCKEGFYGNPTRGTKEDCKPCPCVFGSKCIQIGLRVVCTNCPEGHSGDKCDKCIDGFYGDPSGSRGPKTRCQKCDCNGNIDNNAVLNCDPETGDCLKCIYNTRNGPLKQCELCKVGFYGDATSFPKPGCIACDCHENGTFVFSTTDASQPLPCDEQGQCICRSNVIGKKCDMCIPQYWNIDSKKGCEKCDCDLVGSLNNDCDMNDGQCKCKPGVGGRRCDQCLPDHYQFSESGCKACDCNPEGSRSVSCDENGRCECNKGVLGIKCDQCAENHFNLSAGCVKCPPCYDELKKRVDKLRGILKSLNGSGSSGTGSTDANPDEQFQRSLNNVKEQLLILLDKAESTSLNDKELKERLDQLTVTLLVIETKLNGADRNTTEAGKRGDNADSEIEKADKSIQRSWELLKNIRGSTDETAKIIEEIYNSMKNWSISTLVLKKTAREVRNLSNSQWEVVQELEEMARSALAKSKKADENTDKALNFQNLTEKEVTVINNNINELKALGNMALNNATEAKNIADETFKEADDLLKKGQTPLEKVNANETKEGADETTREAKDVQEEAKRLASQALKAEGDGGRLLLERKKTEYYAMENRTNDLLRRAREANETAHHAILNGTNALEQARKDLKTLEEFNEKINKSRIKAEQAKEKIPEIKRLIESANNKTARAVGEIGDAEDDVEKAIDIADKALKSSEDTTKKAEELKERADNLTIPDDSVYNETKKAEQQIKRYEDQADKDEQTVKNATKMAKESEETAESVMQTIIYAQRNISELSSMISDLDEFDWVKLEQLEKLQSDHVELDESLAPQISAIARKDKIIQESIKKYEIDLEELKKELAKLTTNEKLIPTECLKFKPDPN